MKTDQSTYKFSLLKCAFLLAAFMSSVSCRVANADEAKPWVQPAIKDCSSPESQVSCFQMYEGVTRDQIDNVNFRYPSWPFVMRQKWVDGETKSAVVLVHGLTDSPYSMKDVAKTFFTEHYDAYAILLEGHGKHAIDLDRARWKTWRAQLHKQVDDLLAPKDGSLPYSKIVLVGFSTGGTAVIDFAQHDVNREKISGVVLYSPAVKINDADITGKLANISPLVCALVGAERLFHNGEGGFHYANNQYHPEDFPSQYRGMANNGICQLSEYIGQIHTHGTKAQLPVPTLTNLSEYDTTIKVSAMEKFALANGPEHNAKSRIFVVRNPEYKSSKFTDSAVANANIALVTSKEPVAHEIMPLNVHEFSGPAPTYQRINPVWNEIHQTLVDFIRSLP
jgi:alpha-beta hydrolase superfamily lysophospholipase